MDGMMRGHRVSYRPMLVISRRKPMAVTWVGMTRMAMMKVKANFFSRKL